MPTAARPSAPGAACSSHTLLLAATLLTLGVLICGLGATTAQAAGNSTCGNAAKASAAAPLPPAPPVVVPPIPIGTHLFSASKLVGGLLGRVGAEKLAGIGFEYLFRLTGLSKVFPESETAMILKQLQQVNAKLDDISQRVNSIGRTVDTLVVLGKQHKFESALEPICAIADLQNTLYRLYYAPAIESMGDLGDVLEGQNPGLADQPTRPGKLTLRQEAADRLQEFLDEYGKNALMLESQLTKVHLALMPGLKRSFLLGSYGEVLMGKRFLTRTDSESMRELYSEIADLRTVGAMMSFLYWSSKPAKTEFANQILGNVARTTRIEERNLPPMIPAGAVIDLGRIDAATTDRKPIWLPPSDKDLGWLPKTALGSPFGSVGVTDVEDELSALNKREPGEKDLDWAVPTKAQLTALLSEGCTANLDDPTKTTGTCRSLLGPNTNVARYLMGLEPRDRNWRRLFCQDAQKAICAAGEGPAADKKPPHAFVWTRDTHPEVLVCGFGPIGPPNPITGLPSTVFGTITRTFRTHTGFRTLETGVVWNAFPPLDKGAPANGPAPKTGKDTPDNRCESYYAGIAGRVQGVAPSPWLNGILLANRATGQADVSTENSLDYMAQKTGYDPQPTPMCDGRYATIVGTKGDDKLNGTPGRDVIVGGAGDDVIKAGDGNDLICAGAGHDKVNGGAGKDVIRN